MMKMMKMMKKKMMMIMIPNNECIFQGFKPIHQQNNNDLYLNNVTNNGKSDIGFKDLTIRQPVFVIVLPKNLYHKTADRWMILSLLPIWIEQSLTKNVHGKCELLHLNIEVILLPISTIDEVSFFGSNDMLFGNVTMAKPCWYEIFLLCLIIDFPLQC